MSKTKKPATMVVTIPGTGRQLTVPKGLSGDALANYVQTALKEEAAEAALAEAKAKAAAEELERQQAQELTLQAELDAANRRADAMSQELQELKKASPESAHLLMALSNMNQQASQTLAALNRWDDRKSAEISLVAEELSKRNQVLDDEVLERKKAAAELMNNVAIAQGIAPPHPELLE